MNHNENCLAGIRCPECKAQEAFQIEAKALVDVTDGGTDDPRNIDWEDHSHIECKQCGHHGKVQEFTVVNWPIDAAHPLMVGEEVYFSYPEGFVVIPKTYTVIDVSMEGGSGNLTDDVYRDCVITLRNDAGSELKAYPLDVSRLPLSQQPAISKTAEQPATSKTAATRTYTAMCQQSNGHGTFWIDTVEVPVEDNLEDEHAMARVKARRECHHDWYGSRKLTENIICMGLMEGDVNVVFFDDSHIPQG